MPIRHCVEKDERRLRLVLTGDVDLAEMIAAIDRAVTEPDFEPGFDVLSDHTEIGVPASSSQLEALVEHLRGLPDRRTPKRWAVVTSKPASYGMIRVLSVFAEKIPMEVRAFYSFEEAEEWLAGNASS